MKLFRVKTELGHIYYKAGCSITREILAITDRPSFPRSSFDNLETLAKLMGVKIEVIEVNPTIDRIADALAEESCV